MHSFSVTDTKVFSVMNLKIVLWLEYCRSDTDLILKSMQIGYKIF